MATAYVILMPEEGQFLATTFPGFVRNLGTNFPVTGLAFDATTSEIAFWKFRALGYSTGNLTLHVDWYADTASSGTVTWGAQIAAITPDTDTQDVETDALATAQTVTDTHLGTTGQRVHRAVLTISNLDSIAAEDLMFIKIYRDISDSMTGDAVFIMATVSYTTA